MILVLINHGVSWFKKYFYNWEEFWVILTRIVLLLPFLLLIRMFHKHEVPLLDQSESMHFLLRHLHLLQECFLDLEVVLFWKVFDMQENMEC